MTNKQKGKYLQEHSKILGYDKEKFPLVTCWKIDDYHYSFYCKFCDRIHNHGLGNGHRVSHCDYWKKGYGLVLQGDLTK